MTDIPRDAVTSTSIGAPAGDVFLVDKLAMLTLEQRVRLLTGADFWSLYPEPAIGLRGLVVSDGPAGARGELWDERSTSANVPSPTALAASWDEAGIEEIGRLLAFECRRKGVDVLLAPSINLHRTPYGGRHFENFSEDPLLTGRAGAAFVRGLQSGGVGATVKHFVANDSETDRFTVNVVVGERVLRELYLAPFDLTVREAVAWSVMAAYNSVNSSTMTESPLLREILQQEWGFDGVTMTDWYAGRSLDAAKAGLDLIMPGPTGPWGDALIGAVTKGDVDESVVDDKVLRILRLAARVGALEGVAPGAAAPRYTDAEVNAALRSAAAAGFVLARNETRAGPAGPLLPLAAEGLRRVAVLGPNAEVARTLGGGSATVFPPYTVSPLDGIRAVFGPGVQVVHARGGRSSHRFPPAPLRWLNLPDGAGHGVRVDFLGPDGAVVGTEDRAGAAFTWLGSCGPDLPISAVAAIEVSTLFEADQDGRYVIGASGVGSFRLTIDGEVRVDTVLSLPDGADVVESQMRPPQTGVQVELAAGQQIPVVLRHQVATRGGFGDAEVAVLVFQFNADLETDDATELETAVREAAESDVAIVVVGTTEEVESEGFDRVSLALPGAQDELVRRVAAANPNTVVVVNAGAPVLLPWANDVPAVLLTWFPGQEFGHALADVLLGAAEPGGRLPVTWPATEEGLPSTQPVDGRLVYDEGLLIGYRWYEQQNRVPLYPFGHGLGYTTWEHLAIEARPEPVEGAVTVDVRVRNSGSRTGRHVIQVYLGRPDSAIVRPVRWLAGFAPVEAGPGDEVTISITIPGRAFQHWNDEIHLWALEPGTFTVHAGGSSADLPLSAELMVP